MKTLVTLVAILWTVNSLAVGLLQIPVCCAHKESCPMHRPVADQMPSCHHSDAESNRDAKGAVLQNCDPIKVVSTLVEPAVLPVNPAHHFNVIEESLFVDPAFSATIGYLGIPEQPPRI